MLAFYLAVCVVSGIDAVVPNVQRQFPFVAPPERQSQIKEGYRQIKAGDLAKDVEARLGGPDEIRPLYRGVKDGQPIRTTYWYFIEQRAKGDLRGAKLVRISFDLDKRAVKVDHWGFDEGKP